MNNFSATMPTMKELEEKFVQTVAAEQQDGAKGLTWILTKMEWNP